MMLGENGVLFDKRQIDFVNCKTKLKFNLIYNWCKREGGLAKFYTGFINYLYIENFTKRTENFDFEFILFELKENQNLYRNFCDWSKGRFRFSLFKIYGSVLLGFYFLFDFSVSRIE